MLLYILKVVEVVSDCGWLMGSCGREVVAGGRAIRTMTGVSAELVEYYAPARLNP